MNNKFTKEYIRECDCKEIQGLKKSIVYGDWFYDGIFEHSPIRAAINRNNPITYKEQIIWLPTGDQLDEEIVKILKKITKKERDHFYSYEVSFIDGLVSQWEVSYQDRDNKIGLLEDNILIAKIKLLKQLIKELE